MKDMEFRVRIAQILVYGHIALFAFGLFVVLMVPNKFGYLDHLHVVLMGLPMIAATSLAAFDWTLRERTSRKTGRSVPAPVVRMTTVVCVSAIGISFALYSLPLFEIKNFTVDASKALIGGVETVLGVYLGKISKHLFPDPAPVEAGQ